MDQDYIEAVWVGLQGYVSDFKGCLEGVIREGPSVPGKLGGIDFQQFSTRQVQKRTGCSNVAVVTTRRRGVGAPGRFVPCRGN